MFGLLLIDEWKVIGDKVGGMRIGYGYGCGCGFEYKYGGIFAYIFTFWGLVDFIISFLLFSNKEWSIFLLD